MATATAAWRLTRSDWLTGFALLSGVLFVWLIARETFTQRWPAHAGHHPLLLAHIVGGTGMVLAGAIGLRIGLTRQGFSWHRQVGYFYLGTGTFASLSALLRSLDAQHTPGLSTASLAVVWLAFSAMGWRAIRNRRIDQHREWMIRSYIVAWTFVFCRFWSRAMPDPLQGPEKDMIWFTWVAPVLLTEILLQWRRGAPVSAGRG